MQFHSNEKPQPPGIAKSHYPKNYSNHLNAKPVEPSMNLKISEAKLNYSGSKSSEMSLYVKVIYGSQEWNTNVENVSDYNPKWQEVTFKFKFSIFHFDNFLYFSRKLSFLTMM